MSATEEKGKKDRGQKERQAECLPDQVPLARVPYTNRDTPSNHRLSAAQVAPLWQTNEGNRRPSAAEDA